MDDFGTKTLSLKPKRIVYHHAEEYTCFDLEKLAVIGLERLDATALVW